MFTNGGHFIRRDSQHISEVVAVFILSVTVGELPFGIERLDHSNPLTAVNRHFFQLTRLIIDRHGIAGSVPDVDATLSMMLFRYPVARGIIGVGGVSIGLGNGRLKIHPLKDYIIHIIHYIYFFKNTTDSIAIIIHNIEGKPLPNNDVVNSKRPITSKIATFLNCLIDRKINIIMSNNTSTITA